MGQVLHGCATTTHAVRTAIQRSKAPLKELAARYGLNHKTVAKWRKRAFVNDAPMGPKTPRSTVLSSEEEAIIVAFRKHTLLPLDDCLYALQATIPHLTRSSLHRCLKRHAISRLPEIAGDKAAKKPFKRYPIGYFHLDIAEVRTEEGKLYLFVAIDRTSKFVFAQLHEAANVKSAVGFLQALIEAVPYTIHTVDGQRHTVRRYALTAYRPDGPLQIAHVRPHLPRAKHRAPPYQAEPSLDQRSGRADEPHPQGSHRSALSLRDPPAAPRAPRSLPQRLFTPYEHICKAWADQPSRFRYDPTHLTSGLNS
jgi:hypothetical protein